MAVLRRRSAAEIHVLVPVVHSVLGWNADLKSGDVIDFYLDPDRIDVKELYTTVVWISWLYNVPG